jgi:predicted transcriptional regulator
METLSKKQQEIFDYVKHNTEGFVAEDIRHLLDGNIISARSILRKLAEKKALKKKVIKKKQFVLGEGPVNIKTAVYYPCKN